jgi:hypothetical protein
MIFLNASQVLLLLNPHVVTKLETAGPVSGEDDERHIIVLAVFVILLTRLNSLEILIAPFHIQA